MDSFEIKTELSRLGLVPNKNDHKRIIGYESSDKKSSFYVKTSSSGAAVKKSPIVIHPDWRLSFSGDRIPGVTIELDPHFNSNQTHFPKNNSNPSPYGMDLSVANARALRTVLARIGRLQRFSLPDPILDVEIAEPSLEGLPPTER